MLLGEINGESFSHAYIARVYRKKDSARGDIIGYNFFWVVANEVHILNIAVEPAYQRQGLGRALMQFAFEVGQQQGADVALLEVRFSNTAAQQLYSRLGFHTIGVRKQYYSDNNEDAYVMKLIMPAAHGVAALTC